MYRKVASEDGWEPGPDKFSFMVTCHVDDTDEKAYEEGKHFMWRMRRPLEGPREYFAPPGYVSRRGGVSFSAGAQKGQTNRPKALSELSYDELIESNRIIVGNPDTVIKKLRHIKDTLGIGALMLESQAGKMSHASTMRHIELMGKEVIPALRED
jgi:alkanesulfonate monooxygenase SsuD/methylene tetrahydromethanopterin reductase-like flavin-dependent oxidoreductase (luciferase family)